MKRTIYGDLDKMVAPCGILSALSGVAKTQTVGCEEVLQ